MTSRRSAQFRSLAAYAAAPVFGLATGPILARALGPAGRGELAGMLQPLTVAAGVAAMGVPVAVAYHVARGQGNRSTLMRGLVLAATPALATYFALLAYGVYVANQGGLPIWVYAIAWLSIIPTTAQNTIRAFWRRSVGLEAAGLGANPRASPTSHRHRYAGRLGSNERRSVWIPSHPCNGHRGGCPAIRSPASTAGTIAKLGRPGETLAVCLARRDRLFAGARADQRPWLQRHPQQLGL